MSSPAANDESSILADALADLVRRCHIHVPQEHAALVLVAFAAGASVATSIAQDLLARENEDLAEYAFQRIKAEAATVLADSGLVHPQPH